MLSEAKFVSSNLDLKTYVDDQARYLVMSLESLVMGRKMERIDVEEYWPADWWQAVRERWLPEWWLDKYPVKYKSVCIHKEVWRVCPHLDIKARGPHLSFLINGQEDLQKKLLYLLSSPQNIFLQKKWLGQDNPFVWK